MAEKVFLYGMHAVKEALLNPKRLKKKIWVDPKIFPQFVDQLGDIPWAYAGAAVFEKILGKEVVHQGIVLETHALEEPCLETFLASAEPNKRVVILDQVTDPQNLGAILRSCAAFAIDLLVIPQQHAPTCDGLVAKIASGGLEHVPVVRVSNLARTLDVLKKHDFWCYGLAEEGLDYVNNLKFSGHMAFLFGAEGPGLRRLTKEKCDVLVRIPTSKKFGTLNVSHSVSVMAFLARKS